MRAEADIKTPEKLPEILVKEISWAKAYKLVPSDSFQTQKDSKTKATK